ncbi:MAG: hypothetical protein M1823_005594 [Watsoniomyces obsoletus]|nr:MAG: hypothetical protein M1823_005594 [Watsoniomyces obsoletus]
MVWEHQVRDDLVLRGWDRAVLATMTDEERKEAWLARWGKASCPKGDDLDREEEFRRNFWRGNRVSFPQCYSCFAARAGRPKLPDDHYWGEDDEDLLACGCKYQGAVVEMLMVKHEIITTNPEGGKKTRSADHRAKFLSLVKLLLGENVTMLALLDLATRRTEFLAALTAEVVAEPRLH